MEHEAAASYSIYNKMQLYLIGLPRVFPLAILMLVGVGVEFYRSCCQFCYSQQNILGFLQQLSL